MDSYDVRAGEDLGEIVLVKVQKRKFWVHDDWYCRYITVKTPAGDYVEFPCFRWLVDDKEVVLRDGRGGCPLPICCSSFLKEAERSLTLSCVLQHFCLRMTEPAW